MTASHITQDVLTGWARSRVRPAARPPRAREVWLWSATVPPPFTGDGESGTKKATVTTHK